MHLRSVRLTNFLSFRDLKFDLRQLNVLIGANGSGKSNFIQALRVFQQIPKPQGIDRLTNESGGAPAWLRLSQEGVSEAAGIAAVIADGKTSLTYDLKFGSLGRRVNLQSERLGTAKRNYLAGVIRNGNSPLEPFESVLSRWGRLGDSTPVSQVCEFFEGARIYQHLPTGRNSGPRGGASATTQAAGLNEDGNNLPIVIDRLRMSGGYALFNQFAAEFIDRIERIDTQTENGFIRVYAREKALPQPIFSDHLSDGTLRFLCLLAILLDPTPAPLICIEDPETGLHPDAIRLLGRLLVDQSKHAQIVVATHSPVLIDAIGARQEAVVVCEHRDGETHMSRPSHGELAKWLADYSLGELWQRGFLGGNRW